MTSRLVIGTPRIPAKPPRRIPCLEPYILDDQILADPGFETVSGNGGPLGDEFPEIDASGTGPPGLPTGVMYWPSDLSAAPISSKWCQREPATSFANRWKISTAGPRTGSYHARWTKNAGLAVTAGWLMPVGFTLCRVDQFGPFALPFTARVEPGDLIYASAYFKHIGGTGSEDFVFIECFSNYPDLLSVGASAGPLSTIGASYTLLDRSMVAPAGAKYCRVEYRVAWLGTAGSSVTIDVDDATVSVT